MATDPRWEPGVDPCGGASWVLRGRDGAHAEVDLDTLEWWIYADANACDSVERGLAASESGAQAEAEAAMRERGWL